MFQTQSSYDAHKAIAGPSRSTIGILPKNNALNRNASSVNIRGQSKSSTAIYNLCRERLERSLPRAASTNSIRFRRQPSNKTLNQSASRSIENERLESGTTSTIRGRDHSLSRVPIKGKESDRNVSRPFPRTKESDRNVSLPSPKNGESDRKIARLPRGKESGRNVTKSSSKIKESDRNVTRSASTIRESDRKLVRSASKTKESDRNLARSASKISESDRNVARSTSKIMHSELNVARSASKTRVNERNIARSASKTRENDRYIGRSASKTRASDRKDARAACKIRESDRNVARSTSKTRASDRNVSRSASKTRDVSRSAPKTRESDRNGARSVSKTKECDRNVARSASKIRDSERNPPRHPLKSKVGDKIFAPPVTNAKGKERTVGRPTTHSEATRGVSRSPSKCEKSRDVSAYSLSKQKTSKHSVASPKRPASSASGTRGQPSSTCVPDRAKEKSSALSLKSGGILNSRKLLSHLSLKKLSSFAFRKKAAAKNAASSQKESATKPKGKDRPKSADSALSTSRFEDPTQSSAQWTWSEETVKLSPDQEQPCTQQSHQQSGPEQAPTAISPDQGITVVPISNDAKEQRPDHQVICKPKSSAVPHLESAYQKEDIFSLESFTECPEKSIPKQECYCVPESTSGEESVYSGEISSGDPKEEEVCPPKMIIAKTTEPKSSPENSTGEACQDEEDKPPSISPQGSLAELKRSLQDIRSDVALEKPQQDSEVQHTASPECQDSLKKEGTAVVKKIESHRDVASSLEAPDETLSKVFPEHATKLPPKKTESILRRTASQLEHPCVSSVSLKKKDTASKKDCKPSAIDEKSKVDLSSVPAVISECLSVEPPKKEDSRESKSSSETAVKPRYEEEVPKRNKSKGEVPVQAVDQSGQNEDSCMPSISEPTEPIPETEPVACVMEAGPTEVISTEITTTSGSSTGVAQYQLLAAREGKDPSSDATEVTLDALCSDMSQESLRVTNRGVSKPPPTELICYPEESSGTGDVGKLSPSVSNVSIHESDEGSRSKPTVSDDELKPEEPSSSHEEASPVFTKTDTATSDDAVWDLLCRLPRVEGCKCYNQSQQFSDRRNVSESLTGTSCKEESSEPKPATPKPKSSSTPKLPKAPSDKEKQPAERPSDKEKQPAERPTDKEKEPAEWSTDKEKQPAERSTDKEKQPTERPSDKEKQPAERSTDKEQQPTERPTDKEKQPTERCTDKKTPSKEETPGPKGPKGKSFKDDVPIKPCKPPDLGLVSDEQQAKTVKCISRSAKEQKSSGEERHQTSPKESKSCLDKPPGTDKLPCNTVDVCPQQRRSAAESLESLPMAEQTETNSVEEGTAARCEPISKLKLKKNCKEPTQSDIRDIQEDIRIWKDLYAGCLERLRSLQQMNQAPVRLSERPDRAPESGPSFDKPLRRTSNNCQTSIDEIKGGMDEAVRVLESEYGQVESALRKHSAVLAELVSVLQNRMTAQPEAMRAAEHAELGLGAMKDVKDSIHYLKALITENETLTMQLAAERAKQQVLRQVQVTNDVVDESITATEDKLHRTNSLLKMQMKRLQYEISRLTEAQNIESKAGAILVDQAEADVENDREAFESLQESNERLHELLSSKRFVSGQRVFKRASRGSFLSDDPMGNSYCAFRREQLECRVVISDRVQRNLELSKDEITYLENLGRRMCQQITETNEEIRKSEFAWLQLRKERDELTKDLYPDLERLQMIQDVAKEKLDLESKLRKENMLFRHQLEEFQKDLLEVETELMSGVITRRTEATKNKVLELETLYENAKIHNAKLRDECDAKHLTISRHDSLASLSIDEEEFQRQISEKIQRMELRIQADMDRRLLRPKRYVLEAPGKAKVSFRGQRNVIRAPKNVAEWRRKREVPSGAAEPPKPPQPKDAQELRREILAKLAEEKERAKEQLLRYEAHQIRQTADIVAEPNAQELNELLGRLGRFLNQTRAQEPSPARPPQVGTTAAQSLHGGEFGETLMHLIVQLDQLQSALTGEDSRRRTVRPTVTSERHRELLDKLPDASKRGSENSNPTRGSTNNTNNNNSNQNNKSGGGNNNNSNNSNNNNNPNP